MVVPLANAGGHAIFAIGTEPFSVHPIAIHGPNGEYREFPTTELMRSRRPDFVYEIRPDKPLRTADDPRSLARRWTARYLDPPLHYH
jgi:hypothetical protein